MTAPRAFDVVSLGRLTLELRAQQHGARVEDATSFTRQVGGAAAGIAFGCARLGLRTALVSRVGDDAAGRFVVEALAAEGCDVSRVAVDRERATALLLVGDDDRGSSRAGHGDGADLAIDDRAADEALIASARTLVVTGSFLATERTARVTASAVEHARRHDVRTVLDLDRGAAEVAPEHQARLQALLDRFDLIVGTEAELRLVGGDDDLSQALGTIRRATPATLVVKHGKATCSYIEGEPGSRQDASAPFAHIDAGDAFLAGLLRGWLAGGGWREACRAAHACGQIVLERHGGTTAMPSAAELDYVLSNDVGVSDPRFARVHRAAPRGRSWDDVCVIAIDDRVQAFELAREAGALERRTELLKQLLVRAVGEAEQAGSLHVHVGVLVDDAYGADALASADRSWWLARPVEIPGSLPVEFEGGRSIGSRLVTWPRHHVVKCRVQFHPDAPVDERLEQETQLSALHSAVLASGHELLLEVALPRNLPSNDDTIERAIKRLYNIGIFPDWWSLEAMPAQTWRKLDALIAERDPRCRGVLALDPGELAAPASSRSCRGILIGSTAFRAASLAWLSGAIDDAALVAQARAAFEARVAAWRQARGAKAAT